MARRTYGRTYPIRGRDVRSYGYTKPPPRQRPMRPNPIGVTTLAAVNGPGAYERALRNRRSAYEATYGMNASERSARARTVVRGEPMRHPLQRRNARKPAARTSPKRSRASHTPNAKKLTEKQKQASADRRSRREQEYKKAVRSGYDEKEAAQRAMRVVPYLKREKTKGRTYKGVPVYAGPKKKVRKLPKQFKTVKTYRRRKVTKKVPVKRKVRVAYGQFVRKYLTDPKTGKRKLSYMYVDKKGKLRKIPKWAIAGAESAKDFKSSRYDKPRARIEKRRASAARKVQRSGGPFVPNRKGKKKMRKNRRKLSKAERSRIARKAAKARWRKAKVRKGKTYAGRTLKRGKVYYRGKKPSGLKRRARVGSRRKSVRKLPKARLYVTNRRRKAKANRRHKSNATAKQRAAARRNIKKAQAANRRRGGGGRRRKTTRRRKSTRRRAGTVRVHTANRRRTRRNGTRKGQRRRTARRAYEPNRRRRRRGRRRSSRKRRSYRRNQFGARLKKVATSALFITTGFIAHKALTYVLCDKLICGMLLKKTPAEAAAQNAAAAGRLGQNNGAVQSANGKDTLRQVMPIFVGLGVAALGTFASAKLAPKHAAEIGGGMFTSWLHTTIVTLLGMSSGTAGVRSYIAGTDRMSTAAAIGRYRRRGLRGLGAAPQHTILPHYAPTGRPGGIQQAVAQAGMGEYFAASGMGEYFASSGVRGVGQYEKAGPLVTQASAGVGQVVDDGIRPDSNLDDVLTLAEAQAGLGEYYSARPDGQMYSLPQRSTWVPGTTAPELWSGTKPASDAQATSELPAGILQTPGGNGIFG